MAIAGIAALRLCSSSTLLDFFMLHMPIYAGTLRASTCQESTKHHGKCVGRVRMFGVSTWHIQAPRDLPLSLSGRVHLRA